MGALPRVRRARKRFYPAPKVLLGGFIECPPTRCADCSSFRRFAGCACVPWWLAKLSMPDKLKLLMGLLSAVHAAVMTAEVYGHSQQQQRSQKCTAAG